MGGRIVRIVLAIAVGLLAAEGALRAIVLTDFLAEWGPLVRARAQLREPWRYANSDESAYWALKARFLGDRIRNRPNIPDPNLGWLKRSLRPGTYAHDAEARMGDRRPLLLYGDSFAHCTTARHDCFDGLFQDRPAAAELHFLNYGVGGYGFDQTLLLLRASIDRFENPVVIVSCMIDDDLERGLLDVRSWPKPRLVERAGRLEVEGRLPSGLRGYLEERGTGITSYLWSWFTHSSLVPEALAGTLNGRNARHAQTRTLTRRILRDVQAELDGRGLDWFFLVFHGNASLVPEARWEWREAFVLEGLRDAGIPFVSSKRALLEDAAQTGIPVADYFNGGHYGPRGNRAVLNAIERGLAGEFDSYDGFVAPEGVRLEH